MLVWADSFDHYGTTPSGGRDAMLAGSWAQIEAGNGILPYVSNERARTGDHSLCFEYQSVQVGTPKARRVFGASQIVVGVASAWYFTGLPSANKNMGLEFRDNTNTAIAMLAIESDGAIGLYTGAGHVLRISSDPVISAGSWNHIEAKLVIDEIVGSCEVRVNGKVVIHLTDMNLGALGATQIVFGMPFGANNGITSNKWFIEDLVAWNDAGDFNNDFVGQRRVTTFFATANATPDDWLVTGGASAYEAISEEAPDGDTSYISAPDVDMKSAFEFGDLPPETADIAGFFIPVMAKLDDAGIGAIEIGMQSDGDEAVSTDIPLTTSYSYWGAAFEFDPATGEPWTLEAANNATVSVKKVT